MRFIVEQIWYGKHFLKYLLAPFSWIYCACVRLRRWYLQSWRQILWPVPVIVVGNISIGGSGKTPLVIALAKKARQKGLKAGIVSRGYKAEQTVFPYEVKPGDPAKRVGDEPLLMALKSECPVVIAPKRADAVRYLIDKHQVDLIISDDGLQHYRMGRAIEIAVIDGSRGVGNGFCLPAGPLRERVSRLQEVDFTVVTEGTWNNAYTMTLKPQSIINLRTLEEIRPEALQGSIAAVAGIGNPQRFYSTLTNLGLEFNAYSYPDHYAFQLKDLDCSENLLIMTEKDAVKCRSLANDKMHYLPVEAELDEAFWDALWRHKQLQGYC